MEVEKVSNAIRTTKSVHTAKIINGDKWKKRKQEEGGENAEWEAIKKAE